MKKKGFTLTELIAVLVILAILVLIVTPLVMNIIRKARISADKRSVDAYGQSVESAIANYLLDNGDFPTDISQLTIEYLGDEVVCTTTQLNSDSSVYLAGCTVGGRSVENYTYGSDKIPPAPTYTAYEVGDEVSYNNVDYYVIENSGTDESTVTLLKALPITSAEIRQYLSSTEVASKVSTGGKYATIAYYSNDNCVSAGDISGCSTDYELSDIKQVVDVWEENYASESTEARLITYDELTDNLGYEKKNIGTIFPSTNGDTPCWIYSSNVEYWYWTMSQYADSFSNLWNVNYGGYLMDYSSASSGGVIRPVIVLSKSFLN